MKLVQLATQLVIKTGSHLPVTSALIVHHVTVNLLGMDTILVENSAVQCLQCHIVIEKAGALTNAQMVKQAMVVALNGTNASSPTPSSQQSTTLESST